MLDHLTLAMYCRGSARRFPERNVLEWHGGSRTWAEFDHRTDSLAQAFLEATPSGERIGIYCSNRVEWIESYVGAHKAGIAVVPINRRYRRREVDHVVSTAAVGFVVHDETDDDDPDVWSRLDSIGRLPIGPAYERAATSHQLRNAFRGDPEDVIVFTSGTTALPKGVRYTNATQVASLLMPIIAQGLGSFDRFLLFTPLAHRAAQAVLLSALALGSTTYLLDQFAATDLVRVVEERGITVINAVPTALRDLLSLHQQESIPSMEAVRHVFQSGESLPVSTLSEIMALFPNARFGSAYGSTEAGLVSYLDHEDHLERPRSCGRLLPGVDVRLRQDDGNEAPTGEAGEVLVWAGDPGTYTVAAGYLDPLEPFVDADGWFHTGDVATVDEAGYYRIVDRKKDMILSGGTNISSKEVEEIIASHPGVREVVVTAEPDERFGERVVAWIVEQPGVRLDADQVRRYVADHADPYKRPRVVYFIDSLPRSVTGKLMKRALREDATYQRKARIG